MKAYLDELFKAAGASMDDSAKQAVTNFFNQDAVAKHVESGQLRQSDYSRNMDALAAEKKRTVDYYQQLVTWKADQDALYAGQSAQSSAVAPDSLTRKDLEALEKKFSDAAKQQEANYVSALKMMGRLSSQHAVEFKEPLDTDALEKIVIEKQLPLQQAYAQMIEPRRKAAQEADFTAKLAAAKVEGAREFASTHHIPVDTAPRESEYGRLGFDGRTEQPVVTDYEKNTGRLSPQATRALRDNFVKNWEEAGSAPQR
jgi:hypothetical protein